MTVSGLNIETLPVSDVMCPCLMQMSPIIHFVDACATWHLFCKIAGHVGDTEIPSVHDYTKWLSILITNDNSEDYNATRHLTVSSDAMFYYCCYWILCI